MKKYLHVLSTFSLFYATAYAQQKDTIYITDFGATPHSCENCVTQIQAAIDECKCTRAKVLSLPNGHYGTWPKGVTHKEYLISSTSTEQECPSKVKAVGLMLGKINDLTTEGSGTILMYHGKMTTPALEHCNHVRINSLHIDFKRPAGSEVQYKKMTRGEAEVSIHPDTRYEIVDGKINLYGEGWHSSKNHCIKYSPGTESFTCNQGWNILANSVAQEISPGIIRFTIPAGFIPKVGNTLAICNMIRDQVGLFILEGKDIALSRVQMHYMCGLGIISQCTENATMDRVKYAPRPGSSRLLIASADMMHFSGCKEKILIDSCYSAGAQDDPANIHGTNLRAIEEVDMQILRSRFMHEQSYGFNAYFKGDIVAFVRAATMERFARAIARSVARISSRMLEVHFNRDIPTSMELNHGCIGNMTRTPEVEVRNNYFIRTSTRSTSVITPRKVVIESNTCYKTGVGAILIGIDARGWYGPGPVKDVWIKGNAFIGCVYSGDPGHAVIAIHPSNKIVDVSYPTHQNIHIENNTFRTFDYPVFYAKSAAELLFGNNTITCTRISLIASGNPYTFYLNGRKSAMIESTVSEGEVLGWNIKTENMRRSRLKTTLK